MTNRKCDVYLCRMSGITDEAHPRIRLSKPWLQVDYGSVSALFTVFDLCHHLRNLLTNAEIFLLPRVICNGSGLTYFYTGKQLLRKDLLSGIKLLSRCLPPAIYDEQLGQVPHDTSRRWCARPGIAAPAISCLRRLDRTAQFPSRVLYFPVSTSRRMILAGTASSCASKVLPDWVQRRTVEAKPVAITLGSPPATGNTSSLCSESTPAICLPSSEIAGRMK